MTREEMLACLEDRPCNVCKYHTEKGCERWSCVFEEEPGDTENKGVRIHGHWESKYPTREEIIYCQERYFCSNCKNYVVDRIARLEFNFCPNCGADMREPKGEKEA